VASSGEDLVGLAIRGVAAAIASGTALVALTLWGVQRLVAGTPGSPMPVTRGPAPVLLLLGTVGALCLSAGVAWRRLAPVGSYYRRGGLAILSAFGTFLVAVLAVPLHHFAGRVALLVLAAAAAGAAVLLSRR
jgi:hypothetical protein